MNSTTTAEFKEDNLRIVGMFRVEELRADSGYYDPYVLEPFNPDIIVQRKGDLTTYDKMRRDDQIKAVLWLKKFMVLSTGWTIEQYKDEEQEEEVEFLKKVLTDIEEPDFGDALINILTHIDYGFSVTEPVFKVNAENKVVLRKLKTRAPHTFEFHQDKYGAIEKVKQFTGEEDVWFDIKKMLYLTHQSDFGNPYGTSDLQAAYRAFFAKDIIIRFWNVYLERFSNPHVVAIMPKNIYPTEKQNMLDVLKTLQVKTGIVVPEGTDLKLLFPPSGNTDFERAIDKYNMMIARSMLIPDLIGIGGKETDGGSFALGEKHFQMFFMTINKIRNDLSRLINRKLVQPLCLWNFGIKDGCPVWKLNELTDSEKIKLLGLWVEATKGKIWKPTDEEINHFRREVRFPESEEIERVEEPKPSPFKKAEEKKENNCEKDIEEVGFVKLNRPKTLYEEKVDFAKVNDDLNKLEDDAYALLAPIFKKIKGSTVAIVENIVEKQNISKINKLTLKHLKELQAAWKRILKNTYDGGADSANSEIKKFSTMVKPLPALFEDTIEARSFYITGLENEQITKKVKTIILSGIDNGDTVDKTVSNLEEYFDDDYDWIKQPGPNVIGQRLETIVRTNTIKAYNFGRRKQFESPELKGFVQGYQFSAILDARTSDICNTLDGKTYKITDPYISRITPPVHFNCRSLLIPITINEPFKPDKRINPELFPKGFR